MFVPAGAKPIGRVALCSMRMFIPDVGGRPPTKNTAAQSRALSLTPNDPIITTGHPNFAQYYALNMKQNICRRLANVMQTFRPDLRGGWRTNRRRLATTHKRTSECQRR